MTIADHDAPHHQLLKSTVSQTIPLISASPRRPTTRAFAHFFIYLLVRQQAAEDIVNSTAQNLPGGSSWNSEFSITFSPAFTTKALYNIS